MPGKHVHFSEDVLFPPTPSPTYSSSSLPSSSGPFTPPQVGAYLPNGVAVHPVLQFTGPQPHLFFDVTLPIQNLRLSTNIPAEVVNEHATAPPLPSIVLSHPRLRAWEITIKPKAGKYVRVGDVLEGIYTSLRKPATGQDYDSLPSRAAQSEVTAAFTRRWTRIPDMTAKSVEKSKGLKRVDFLGSTVTFAGLFPSKQGPNYWVLNLA
ncbi:hypothetical protein C8R44DRAFT_764689 [Mycena epipterygia]|nr:hypothetical protein C8R44DRAFT_764689 [Mycena epipterygia]